jgi:hypothetical protein
MKPISNAKLKAIGLRRKSNAGKSSDGGAGGIRTPDLLDAIEARSQLRHGPTVSNVEKL